MAQLGGKAVRTVITQLELLADDGSFVLMLDAITDGGAALKVRRPWESTWGSYPTFTITRRDADIVAKLIAGQDGNYVRTQLDELPTSDFTGVDPNPPEDVAAQAEYEARCTELDIERARAANIQQEFILDHSRDKHITADVTGCPTCEAKVITSRVDFDGNVVDDVEEELPF